MRLVGAAACAVVAACNVAGTPAEDGVPTIRGDSVKTSIEEAVRRASMDFMKMDGVTGVGQGLCDGTPCIRVYVLTDAAAARLPKSQDGHPVSPVVTGRVEATTRD